MEKAKTEYRKFQQANLSPVEKAYMESLRELQKTAEKESKKR